MFKKREVCLCIGNTVLTGIMEHFVDEVDMGEKHPTAAIAFEAKCVKCGAWCHATTNHLLIRLPFVTNNTSTSKATNWNKHFFK